jgi:AP-1 complex subunit sigma 1/2
VAGKKAGSDKKLYNSLDKQYQEMAKSPDANAYLSVSPFGPLTERSSRKTLIDLIATLNMAFPDYDFTYEIGHFRYLFMFEI